jgi:hypothetical protein
MAQERTATPGEEPVTEWIVTPFDELASAWIETQSVGRGDDLLYDPGFTRASCRESVLEKMPASRRHRALVLLPRQITMKTIESLLEKDFDRFLRFDLPMGDRFDEVEIRFV